MKKFNKRDKFKNLFSIYTIANIELNFYKKCYQIHASKTLYSENIIYQVIEQIRRYENFFLIV